MEMASVMKPFAEKKRHFGDFLRYHLIRLHRLSALSHDIALGVAWGVVVSFTPFLGFHLILCTVLCVLFGGSKVAAWIGTIVGNPATFPLFFWADFQLGQRIIQLFSQSSGAVAETTVDFKLDSLSQLTSGDTLTTLLLPIFLGSLVFGPMAGAISYAATRRFVQMTRNRHQRKMAKARSRQTARTSSSDIAS